MIEAARTPAGTVIVSVILGLGLAAIFRRACKGNECVVIRAPELSRTQGHVYRIEDDCYTYTRTPAQCPVATAAAAMLNTISDAAARRSRRDKGNRGVMGHLLGWASVFCFTARPDGRTPAASCIERRDSA